MADLETVSSGNPVEQLKLSAVLEKVAVALESSEDVSWESIGKLVDNEEFKDLSAGIDWKTLKEMMEFLVKYLSVGFDLKTLKEMMEFLGKWISQKDTPIIRTKWPPVNNNDLVHCNTVEEVQLKVNECLSNGSVLRVAGAQHSAPAAVFAPEGKKSVRVKLEGDLRVIEWLDDAKGDTAKLRVGAGCNLGIDPSDPKSNAGNSLNRVLDARGYALPILGGMSHQTIAGYMSTSTAGGSIDFGCADSIVAIELVDGRGQVRNLDKVANPDEFNAAAVSMGLFGVFTHITIMAVKRYLVKGEEKTVEREHSILESGTAFLNAVHQNQYVHNVWLPAKGVNNVLQWTGNRVSEDPPIHRLQPYEHPLKSRSKNYVVALALLLMGLFMHQGQPKVAACILSEIQKRGTHQEFLDHWYNALPNDDQALIDTVMRVQFTEIWIDLEDAPEVLDTLIKLFENDQTAAGYLGVEIYPARRSPFWMSMSYGRDVIRVDPYWWEYTVEGDLETYFDKFWKVLLPFDSARLHWGKHWPAVGKTYGGRTVGPDFIQKSYPKFGEWKALRAQFDPKNVFVTKYWDDLLGLSKVAAQSA